MTTDIFVFGLLILVVVALIVLALTVQESSGDED
jgi:hypothetical protein